MGYGPAWARWDRVDERGEMTLRLVRDDVPIEGRVVDLEGRPVPGAKVNVGFLLATAGENLTPWLQALQTGDDIDGADARFMIDSLPPQATGIQADIVTDDGGRFRVTGIGRERVASLTVTGPTIAYNQFYAATRIMETIAHVKGAALDFGEGSIVGARPEIVAAPGRTVIGTVRDARTGEPLAGVDVDIDALSGMEIGFNGTLEHSAVTDDRGRYRLDSVPKGPGNGLIVMPNDDQPYFNRTAAVPDEPGVGPIALDIELHRGIWITGTVTDKRTG